MERQPLQQWAADSLELPKTKDGHRYVLVITDIFSKLDEVFALWPQTAKRLQTVWRGSSVDM